MVGLQRKEKKYFSTDVSASMYTHRKRNIISVFWSMTLHQNIHTNITERTEPCGYSHTELGGYGHSPKKG